MTVPSTSKTKLEWLLETAATMGDMELSVLAVGVGSDDETAGEAWQSFHVTREVLYEDVGDDVLGTSVPPRMKAAA